MTGHRVAASPPGASSKRAGGHRGLPLHRVAIRRLLLHGDSWRRRRPQGEILATVKDFVTRRLPSAYEVDPKQDIPVLIPMHRGTFGVASLNAELQELLTPRPVVSPSLGSFLGSAGMPTANH